ncbi:MAG: matrixin family metalloprotease [Candidatus Bathyarchaeia archaeon]|jgi:hypothetical protein
MNFYGFLMIGLLVLSFPVFQVQAQTQDTPIIEVGGYLWNKTTLNVLIVAENQSEWSSGLVNSTIRAIEGWNHAITYFSANYSGFSYLSAVNMQVQVSNETKPDFDVYVNFSDAVSVASRDAIGATTTVPYGNGTIQKCVVTLATTSQYVTLTQKDIQSVAAHEFGHVLGIGHSNASSDLMFPMFDIYAAQYEISTLDMYGVANAFQWIINPDLNVPSAKQELTLPAIIAYEYIPSTQPVPQSITDNPTIRALEVLANVLLTPYILLMIALGISILVLIELYYRRKGQTKNRAEP